MVLDGFGLSDEHEYNAVYQAKTPVIDKLMAECPFVKGYASGLAVGLPDGQMGNSEVGHMNIGSGRIIYQDLTLITKYIEDGVLRKRIPIFISGGFFQTVEYILTTHIFMLFLNFAKRKILNVYLSIPSLMEEIHRPRVAMTILRLLSIRQKRSV